MDLWSMTGDTFYQAYTARIPVDPGYPAHRATTAAVLHELHAQAASKAGQQGEL